MSSLFGTARASNPGRFDSKSHTLTTTSPPLKVQELEKRLHHSNSAARRQIAFKFHKMVLCGTMEAAELSKPT